MGLPHTNFPSHHYMPTRQTDCAQNQATANSFLTNTTISKQIRYLYLWYTFGTPYITFIFSVHFKPSVQIPAAFNSHGVQFSIILVVNERINVRLLHNINCNNIFSTFEQSLEEVYARRVIEIASAEYQTWCCQCTGHSL